jgi:hypothetical protein
MNFDGCIFLEVVIGLVGSGQINLIFKKIKLGWLDKFEWVWLDYMLFDLGLDELV